MPLGSVCRRQTGWESLEPQSCFSFLPYNYEFLTINVFLLLYLNKYCVSQKLKMEKNGNSCRRNLKLCINTTTYSKNPLEE